MGKTGKGLVRGLTIAALGFSLVVPGLAPVVAAAEEGPGVTPFAIIESVLDTFKTEQCLTTNDHDWEGGLHVPEHHVPHELRPRPSRHREPCREISLPLSDQSQGNLHNMEERVSYVVA